MAEIIVASTEFKNRAGVYMEKSGKQPVVITRHNRPAKVLKAARRRHRELARKRIVHPARLRSIGTA